MRHFPSLSLSSLAIQGTPGAGTQSSDVLIPGAMYNIQHGSAAAFVQN